MQLTVSKDSFNNLVQFASANNIHYKKLAAHLVQIGLNVAQKNGRLFVENEAGRTEIDLNLDSLKGTHEVTA